MIYTEYQYLCKHGGMFSIKSGSQ